MAVTSRSLRASGLLLATGLLAHGGILAQTAPTTPPSTSKADICGDPAGWPCGRAYDALGVPAAQVVEFLDTPISVLLIILIAFVLNRIAHVFIKRAMNRLLSDTSTRTRKALRRATPNVLLKTAPVNMRIAARVQTLTAVFRSIVSVVIWFIAILAIVEALGLNLTTLVAPASIIGVALGFGAQNIVKDFLAGIFIVLEDQFGVGDVVDIGGDAKGTVEQLTLRSTRVRDVNGTVWHVPNGQIVRAANKSQEWARALLDIEVDGSNEYERVAAVIEGVAQEMSADERWMIEIIDSPELWGVESFTEQGYTVRLVVKTRPASQFGVMRELRIRMLAAFEEHGILLPGDHWAVEHLSGLVVPDPDEPDPDKPEPDRPQPDKPQPDKPEPDEPVTSERAVPPHPPRGDPGGAG